MNNPWNIQAAVWKCGVLAVLPLLVCQCREETPPALGKQEPAKESAASPASSEAPQKPASLANVEDLLALFDATRPTRSLHAVREAIREVPKPQLISWWEEVSAGKATISFELSAKTALAARFAEIAPAEAQAWTAGNAGSRDAGLLVERLAAETALKPGADLSCPFPPEEDKLQNAWLRGVTAVLVNREPESAWRWARDLAVGKLRDEATSKVLRRLAKSHPSIAARCFGEIQSQEGDLQRTILTAWLREDPDAALAWIREQPEASQKSLEEHYFQSLAAIHPRLAIQKIRGLEDALKRRELTGKIGQAITKSNPALAVELLLEDSRTDENFGVLNRGIAKALELWMATDGAAAQRWMLRTGDLSFDGYAAGMRALLDELGPGAALAFYRQVSKESIPASLNYNLFSHWAFTDPHGLKRVYEESPDLLQQTEVYIPGLVAANLAQRSGAEALDLLLKMPLSKFGKEEHFSQFFESAGHGDPSGTAKLMADLLQRKEFAQEPVAEGSPDERDQASGKVNIQQSSVGDLAGRYARASPEAAAQWAEKLPAAYQNAARCGVAMIWADLDPVAASEFIARLPMSPGRHEAVEVLAKRIEAFDPEGASKWRESLPKVEDSN